MQRQMIPDREEKPLSFVNPERWKTDPKTGLDVVDEERSEEFRLFEALGTPKVYYGVKMNKYFRDPKCEKPYLSTEIAALGLPTTQEIDAAREKLRKKSYDENLNMSALDIARATAPTHIEPPDAIKNRLASTDVTDRSIARINRSTLGKI